MIVFALSAISRGVPVKTISPPAAGRAGRFRNKTHEPPDECLLHRGGVAVYEYPVKIVRNTVHTLIQPFAVPGVRAVKHAIPLLFGKVLPLPVEREETGGGILFPVPVAWMEGGEIGHAFVPRLFWVNAPLHIDRHHPADPGALRAHAVRVVEREAGGCSDIRLADARVQKPQRGVHIADRADSRAGVPAETRLIDDHGGGEIFNALDLRLFVLGKSAAVRG